MNIPTESAGDREARSGIMLMTKAIHVGTFTDVIVDGDMVLEYLRSLGWRAPSDPVTEEQARIGHELLVRRMGVRISRVAMRDAIQAALNAGAKP